MQQCVRIVAVLSLVLSATAAYAQGLGVRAGASADPNQFYFGGHYESEDLVDRLRFQPNVEIGVGDDRTLVALNFEFTYRLPKPAVPGWQFYVGGGPALNIYHFRDDTDPEGGFNGLAGLSHPSGLFVEAKIGAIKSARFKLGVGYTFR